MLNLVVGLGVQGTKRIKYLEEEFITVDPENEKADFKKLSEVPLNKITHALAENLCVRTRSQETSCNILSN